MTYNNIHPTGFSPECPLNGTKETEDASHMNAPLLNGTEKTEDVPHMNALM